MKASNLTVSAKSHMTRPSIQERRPLTSSMTAVLLEDVQREHIDIFTQVATYNHAVAQGEDRGRLLAMFNTIFQCVQEHFRAEETLLEQTSWLLFQPHYENHRGLEDELAAFRARLAGNESIDPLECEHALDGLLIHHIMERPLFTNLHASSVQGDVQWIWSGAWYRTGNEEEI